MGVFVSASRVSFQHFTNKNTRGPLQQFLSSDLIGSERRGEKSPSGGEISSETNTSNHFYNISKELAFDEDQGKLTHLQTITIHDGQSVKILQRTVTKTSTPNNSTLCPVKKAIDYLRVTFVFDNLKRHRGQNSSLMGQS